MKTRMIWKFTIPTIAIIIIGTLACMVVISGYIKEQIRGRAHELIKSRIEQVTGSLDVTNTIMLEKVHASMKVLMSEGLATGIPSAGETTRAGTETVQNILLGSKPQAQNFALVDHVKSLMGGTATLFVKRGGDFVRITTNVMKDDGSRAIGTFLDPKGKAIAAIREGKAFYGQVDILGKPYITGYEPMYDKSNSVIGVWYVGYPVATFTQLGETISKTRILDNGFIALMDDHGKVRFRSGNVSEELVENLLKSETNESGKWKIIKEPFEPWGFQVVAAYPVSDIGNKVIKSVLIVILSGIAFAAFLIGSLYLLIKKIILTPISSMMTVADHLSKGDMRVNLETSSKDETGQLISALKNMIGNLKKILLQTRESSNQVSAASEQIAEANQNFSQRITEQAASIEETSATMEEMSASIKHTAENAREANKLAQATRSLAESGVGVMSDTIKAMDEINRSSGRIANISNVIEEIAFQTNLLALNAAVEAARAGEHGKGFAVVASEIRSLAQRASQSAKEITGLIEDSSEKTGRGVQLAHELSRKLEEIGTGVKKVTDLMEEVAAAAGEQSSGINQVNTAMSQIDQTTQQNASLVEETASAAEELAAQAKELRNLIAFFKVDEETEFEKEGLREKEVFHKTSAKERGFRQPMQPERARTLSVQGPRMIFSKTVKEEDSNGGFEEF